MIPKAAPRFPFLACALLLAGAVLPAPAARAAPPVATPRAAPLPGPVLQPAAAELLPLDADARARLRKEHGPLVYYAQAEARQAASLRARLAARKNKADAESRRLAGQLHLTEVQLAALMARVTGELRAYGVDGPLVAAMNHAPAGRDRVDRYAQGLVLLVPDLDTTQRTLMERVVTELEGAWGALDAQRDRTQLALKQTALTKAQTQQVLATFDRQWRVIDQRFWMLVDWVLTRDQKVWLVRRLPARLQVKSQALRHLQALPGLTPSQGMRLQSLMTEIEHEGGPDTAAVRRVGTELRNPKLTKAQRAALGKERSAAYRRLADLQHDRRQRVQEILTHDQWLDFVSIPPHLSTNERSGSQARVLGGWKPNPAQAKRMQVLARAARAETRAAGRRIAEIRRSSADYGPDSPQMMAVQMEMTGAKADTAASRRAYLGALFTQVLTPQEVTSWVTGHWGYRR
jgi:hypothetical protein